MPYYITNDNPECDGWAVEKDDGDVIGCHRSRQDAIDQMVAVSLAEGIEPGGERGAEIDGVKAGSAGDVTDGMKEEAQRGLDWRAEYGRGGTSVGAGTARRIIANDVSNELAVKMRAYFARHEVDQQAEGWNRDEPGYPSAGRIAWALWGGDAGRTWSERVVARYRDEERAAAPTGGTGIREVRTMNVKRLNAAATFHVKAVDGESTGDTGEVVALVSVFNNTDLVGDRVMPGAFGKSLERYAETGRSIPFVWSHQWDNPDAYIGKVVAAVETEKGLEVRATLFDTATARHIKTLLAEGVVGEFSFAYDVIDQQPGDDGVNELKELHILEAGPTLKGANPATELVGVRGIEPDSKAEPGELAEGDYVTWGEGTYGRVEYIMTAGEFGVEGDPLSLQATADDPLAMVRVYVAAGNEYEPTDTFKGFAFSDLDAVDNGAKSVDRETPQTSGTDVADVVKPEDHDGKGEGDDTPTTTQTGMDAYTAYALLELET